ncbi:MAG: cyclic-di-AMP receptor [Clostridia bacterium]|nr:cyclic-di-AMP receptor [Clostridia bacterium]
MKLVLAIVNTDDGDKAMSALNTAGYSVTKLATTGGFLRSGNMTLLIGVEEEQVEGVIDILKDKCSVRKTIMSSPSSPDMAGMVCHYPLEVDVGGATIFVVDVDRFEKV